MLNLDYIIKNKKEVKPLLEEQFLIYFLIKDDEIVYIGKTINLLSRLKDHIKTKEFNDYYYFCCKTQEEIDSLEIDYIVKFNPIYNQTLPTNDRYYTMSKLKEILGFNAWSLKRHINKKGINPIVSLSGSTYYHIKDFENMEE